MKLIFVYNADSGFINTLMDIGHKALDPDTYQCNLCALTFGIIGEHQQWKQFREESEAEMKFLHRNEFEREYNQEFEYPVILKEDQTLEIAIPRSELEDMPTLDRLMERVNQVVAAK